MIYSEGMYDIWNLQPRCVLRSYTYQEYADMKSHHHTMRDLFYKYAFVERANWLIPNPLRANQLDNFGNKRGSYCLVSNSGKDVYD
jgi:hypothetical protein